MNDPYVVAIKMAFIGAMLGVVFFGGLWLTLRQLPMSKRPYLLTLSSVMIRTTAVLSGIWYFAGGEPSAIAGGLGGFLVLQLLATHWSSMFTGGAGSSSDQRGESS